MEYSIIADYREENKSNKINMEYSIIGYFCEQYYKHNVRRAINDFKLNVEDIKLKIMNNIRHLLTYDRQKLINKIFEDFKQTLNKIKTARQNKYCGYYYHLNLDSDYYLYDILSPLTDDETYDTDTIPNVKKLWLKRAKKCINELENEEIEDMFEEKLDKYGRFEDYEEYTPIRILVRIETYYDSSDYNNTNLLDFINK
tara:strand:+ start:860 stop:1456 length:597 start_codon:yes stop_codon:yes gene_type:complete